MNIESLLGMKFERRQDGKDFPAKPNGALTLRQWLKLGYKPKDESSFEIFKLDYCSAYTYIRKENVVPLSAEEIKIVEEAMPSKEKRAELNEARKQKQLQEKKKSVLCSLVQCFNKEIVCFDVESTGFSPKLGDELLQISVVNKYGEVLVDTYLKPHYKKYWPNAEKVHHITPQMVKDAPYPEQIAKNLQKIFDEADIIIGYNVDFDIRFVEHCMNLSIDKEKVMDPMKIFKADNSKADSYSLEGAVREYCPEIMEKYISGAHDSKTDTIATMSVFMAQVGRGIDLENNSVVVKENIDSTSDLKIDLFENPEGPDEDIEFE